MTLRPHAIPVTRTPAPRLSEATRECEKFGAVFSDHVLVADFADGAWGPPRILPYGEQALPVAPLVAHYGQGIFEGFKAFRQPDGSAALFRPDANHRRMERSAARLDMPAVPADLFIEGSRALVAEDFGWIPQKEGSSLYIRPVLFATGETLGVRPSDRYRFVIETCPSPLYFSGAVDLITELVHVRAAPGGTGGIKCAGNYAGSLLAASRAQKAGFTNVLWLDSAQRRFVEEAGMMNVMFVIDGVVLTPPLGEPELSSILPGVTRDSFLTLLRDRGIPVEERPIAIDEVFAAHAAGRLQAAAGVGTAATLAPLRRLAHKGEVITLPPLTADNPLAIVGAHIDDLRRGRVADPYGWLVPV